MKINLLCAAAAVAAAFTGTAARADDGTPEFTVTGSAALATQYRFRGISQSDNKAVVQAAITISHASGFYIATWGSSASGNSAVNIGGSEIDVYGGYTHALGATGLTFDGGLYGYLYPGGAKANGGLPIHYYELYGSLTKAIGPVSVKAGINWAPKQGYFDDWKTNSRYNVYKYAEATVAVPGTAATLHGHLGHTAGGFDYYGHGYFDYTVGASYKVKMLTLDVSLVGTDVSHQDANYVRDVYRDAKPVAVVSLTASF